MHIWVSLFCWIACNEMDVSVIATSISSGTGDAILHLRGISSFRILINSTMKTSSLRDFQGTKATPTIVRITVVCRYASSLCCHAMGCCMWNCFHENHNIMVMKSKKSIPFFYIKWNCIKRGKITASSACSHDCNYVYDVQTTSQEKNDNLSTYNWMRRLRTYLYCLARKVAEWKIILK